MWRSVGIALVVLCLVSAEGAADTRKAGKKKGKAKAAAEPAEGSAPIEHINEKHLENLRNLALTMYHGLFKPGQKFSLTEAGLPGNKLQASNPTKVVAVFMEWFTESEKSARQDAERENGDDEEEAIRATTARALQLLRNKVLDLFPDRRELDADTNAAVYVTAQWLLQKPINPGVNADLKRIFDPEEYEEGDL